MEKKLLSVIIPAYNEEGMIHKTAQTIGKLLEENQISYELIFINDGSKDNTWLNLIDECNHDHRVKAICFSRNFGKEAAMFAGLEKAKGDCAVIIDCDLQHPPEKIIEMYHLWEEGYDVVEGVKEDRGKESIFHRIAANSFYSILSKVTKINMKNASDFKLMDRKVINVLKQMPERNVFFRALSSWVGFKSTSISFSVQERECGESKWSTWSLVKYAFSNIISFSAVPMQIVAILGILFFVTAVILGVQSLIKWGMGNALEGFTTVIIIELFIGSVVMTSMGVIGYYIAMIHEELKGRPRYIVSMELNTNEKII